MNSESTEFEGVIAGGLDVNGRKKGTGILQNMKANVVDIWA